MSCSKTTSVDSRRVALPYYSCKISSHKFEATVNSSICVCQCTSFTNKYMSVVQNGKISIKI